MKKITAYCIQNKAILGLKLMLLSILISLNSSCKKFVEVAPPKNQIIASEVFTNDNTATSAITGLYSQMMTSALYLMNGGLTLYPGLSADEITNTTPSSTIDPFTNNSLLPSSTIISNNLWRNAYIFIYQANACLEGLDKSNSLTPSVKNQLKGETKFIRALNYFYLVNLFGDVPLVTGTDYTINEILPRTASPKIYSAVIADLLDAENLLVATYPTPGQVRVNKWAATALLARVYLYQKDWINAEAKSTLVINSGTYSLPTLPNVFLANSKEAILQFIPAPGNNTSEGSTFIPTSATVIPSYAITPELLNSFEAGDNRKTSWLSSNTIGGKTYSYPFKYKVKTSTTISENYMVLRLAEQYLIRAEARARQNITTGQNSAVTDLNIIRNRAGLSSITVTDQGTLIDIIQKERRVELFAEWGHRWFDLKRTGTVDSVLKSEKIGWLSTSALYPIPLTEIQKNPALVQNPGYQ